MAEESKEPGKVMKFIQDYRMKMLIPELIVVFVVFYLAEESLYTNMYASLGIWSLILQPLYMVPSGILVLVTAFTLHGIYPLDNYHEGKISDLPKAAVVMIIVSFILLPGLVLMQMIGYYLTEATEFVSRNPFWERVESLGDLLFYAGPVFFVGLQWWLPWKADGSVGLQVIKEFAGSEHRPASWYFTLAWRFDSPRFRPGVVAR